MMRVSQPTVVPPNGCGSLINWEMQPAPTDSLVQVKWLISTTRPRSIFTMDRFCSTNCKRICKRFFLSFRSHAAANIDWGSLFSLVCPWISVLYMRWSPKLTSPEALHVWSYGSDCVGFETKKGSTLSLVEIEKERKRWEMMCACACVCTCY